MCDQITRLRVAQLNCGGLFSANAQDRKCPMLKRLLRTHRVDILLIQEFSKQHRSETTKKTATNGTEMHSQSTDFERYFPGYSLHAPSPEVAILYRTDLPVNTINDIRFETSMSHRNLNVCGILLHIGRRDIAFYSYYRSPTKDRGIDADTLFAMEMIGDSAVIGGDINLHHTLWGSKRTEKRADDFVDLLNESNLVLRNNGQVTRRDPKWSTTSAIDLTFATKDLIVENWHSLDHKSTLSDHFWITFDVVIKYEEDANPHRSTWNLRCSRWPSFKKQLKTRAESLHKALDQIDPDLFECDRQTVVDAIEKLAISVTDSLTDTAQATLGTHQYRNRHAPWWNAAISRQQSECRRLHRRKRTIHARKSYKGRTHQWIARQPVYIAAERAWKKARNRKSTLIRRAKHRYNARLNDAMLHGRVGTRELNRLCNPKKFRNANAIPAFTNPADPTQPITDDSTKAEMIHQILITPPQPLFTHEHLAHHAKVEESVRALRASHESAPYELLSESPTDLERHRIQKYELTRVIRDLKDDKACGPDRVHNLFLKRAGTAFHDVLLRLFNLILRSRTYPRCWNKAQITPIPKPGKDHSAPANYRPIAVSSCVGRLYERVLSLRLQTLAHAKQWFSNSSLQCGFQINRCTDDLLNIFLNDAYAALELGSETDAVFTDFAKAYDTIWHNGLIHKLKSLLGLGGNLLHAVIAFLSGRVIRVRLKNGCSTWKPVHIGLPQGSSLSPILYILYANDFQLPVRFRRFIRIGLFADDAALWTYPANKDPIRYQMLQQGLDIFEDWCRLWKLLLNPTKCKSLTITCTKETKIHETWRYRITGNELTRLTTFKYLGLYVDQRLSFDEHMVEVKSRLSALLNRLAFLKKTGTHLKPSAILSLYKSKGRSSIEYGALHYFYKDTKNTMQTMQNKFLRFALCAKRSTPIDLLERLTDLEPVAQRIEHLQCRHWLRTLYAPNGHPLHTAKRDHARYSSQKFTDPKFGDLTIRRRQIRRLNPRLYYPNSPSSRAESTYTTYAAQLKPQIIPSRLPRALPITAVPNYCIPKWPTNYRVTHYPCDPSRHSEHHQFFTDGSNHPNPGKGGYAFWDDRAKDGASRMLPYICNILTSELEAVRLLLDQIAQRAVTIAPSKPPKHTRSCAVFIDNATCLQMIDGQAYPRYAAVHALIKAILTLLSRIEQMEPDITFLFMKIKSHVDAESHRGNSEADNLAHTAAEQCVLDPSQAHKVEFPDALYMLKKYVKDTWNEKWNTRTSSRDVLERLIPEWDPVLTKMFAKLNADEAAMLVRLISGHIELNVYYNKFNYDPTQSYQQRRVDDPRPTAACPKCSAPRETIHHMLLECQAYDTARQTMLHSLDHLHPLTRPSPSTHQTAALYKSICRTTHLSTRFLE